MTTYARLKPRRAFLSFLVILAATSLVVSEGAPRPEQPVSRNDLKGIESRIETLQDRVIELKTLIEKQGIDRLDRQEKKLQGIEDSTAQIRKALAELSISAAPSVWPYVAGGLIGFAASVLSIFGYEFLRRPILGVAVGEPMPAAQGRRFVHVRVSNRSQIWFLQTLAPRLPAHMCRAWVRIYPVQLGGNASITFEGRWANQREPGQYVAAGLLPDPGLILVPHREDILAGDSAMLVVAVKFNGELECFGFNNENYLVPNQRPPDRQVGQGVSRIVVRVAAGDLVRIAEFELQNPGPMVNDFALIGGTREAVWEP